MAVSPGPGGVPSSLLSLLLRLVVGIPQHEEEQDERDEQVGQVDRNKDEFFRESPRSLSFGEVLKQQCGEDRDHGGHGVSRVDDGWSANPLAASCGGGGTERLRAVCAQSTEHCRCSAQHAV